MDPNDKLFSGFPPVTVEEWEAKIQQDLKGADYAKKLIRKTLDNITIKPYYRAEDISKSEADSAPGEFPFVRGNKQQNNDWEIRQDFRVTDLQAAIEKAVLASSRGTDGIGYDLSHKGDLYYHDFRTLLSKVGIDKSFHFITKDTAPQILDFLIKALDELGIDRAGFKGSVEFDPLSYLATSGGYFYSEKDDMADAGKMLTQAKDIPNLRVLSVNSHFFSDTGATIVQELAYALSMTSTYMNALTEQGHSVDFIARHMQWNLGIGSDYFMEIAKIRAARMLFAALATSYNSHEAIGTSVFIHSITTKWNKTLYDPNVNMLRLTTEAMSASLGGCNSLLVEPFDTVYNEPTDFSERLARNIQIILKEESYFNRVVDPAAGSYYIETLTNALVEQAWNHFLQIEDQGGFIQAVMAGTIQKEIEGTVQRRTEMVASRREVLLGTNQFPNVNETINGCIAEDKAFPGEFINAEKVASPVIRKRAAMEFEKLRLAVEKRKTQRPRVFMLTYGSLAMRLARSQFSGNFFACGGYEIIDNHGFKTAEEGVKAAFDAKANIIVVCSSDEEYAEIAPAVADLVKDKAIVVVAGAPANMEELKQKGIHEFIHIRSNVLETLKGFHKKLGIEII